MFSFPFTLKVMHFIFPNKVCKNVKQAMAMLLETHQARPYTYTIDQSIHIHCFIKQNDWMLFGVDGYMIYDTVCTYQRKF
jgi:hypothetical protein